LGYIRWKKDSPKHYKPRQLNILRKYKDNRKIVNKKILKPKDIKDKRRNG